MNVKFTGDKKVVAVKDLPYGAVFSYPTGIGKYPQFYIKCKPIAASDSVFVCNLKTGQLSSINQERQTIPWPGAQIDIGPEGDL